MLDSCTAIHKRLVGAMVFSLSLWAGACDPSPTPSPADRVDMATSVLIAQSTPTPPHSEPTMPTPLRISPTPVRSRTPTPWQEDIGAIAVSATFQQEDGLYAILDIFVLMQDGRDPINLTNSPEVAEDNPSWSPDGTQIAFVASQGSGNAIRLLDVNSGESIQVTHDILVSNRMSWSPDGSQIAFTGVESGQRSDIYILTVADGIVKRMTNTGGKNSAPSWSPDGESIAFASDRAGNFDVYILALDTLAWVQVTNGLQPDFDPVWSPQGDQIAYTCSSERADAICVINPDGTDLRTLTDPNAFEDGQEASWSPDGGQIAFRSLRDGTDSIYVMSVDGSAVQRVSYPPLLCEKPDWRKP